MDETTPKYIPLKAESWAKELGKQCAIALEKIWAEVIDNANAKHKAK